MLSKRSLKRNQVLIPKLLDNHGALLYGDTTVIDLSTAENQLLMKGLLSEFDNTFKAFNWSNNVSRSQVQSIHSTQSFLVIFIYCAKLMCLA